MKPDFAIIVARVTTNGPTLAKVADEHEKRATRALAILHKIQTEGLEIRSSSFNIGQVRRPICPYGLLPAKCQVLPPQFVANTLFMLRMKSLAALNQSVSKLAQSGLFHVEGVQFEVAHNRAALNQARRAAMLDARIQAQTYAEAGGFKLGQVIEVSDGQATSERAMMGGEADLPSRVPALEQIIPPATIKFDASVDVVWRIAATSEKPQ